MEFAFQNTRNFINLFNLQLRYNKTNEQEINKQEMK